MRLLPLKPPVRLLLIALLSLAATVRTARAFDLTFTINNSFLLTSTQLEILNTSLDQVERMWETMITGYQPGIAISSVPITITPTTTGLASASFSGSTNQGGFRLTTSGFVNINRLQIEPFANWQGDGANGLNFIDELLAHEVGHVLGIGTQWLANGVYQSNSYRYTGQYGVAAYAEEFDDELLYVPVENAGGAGTPNSHWDQLMRSSSEEGNPSDPWPLDPRVGVVDTWGRDRALELMTGAIDPDFREPFVGRFTIQSMRDLGYAVTEFEDFNGDGLIDLADREIVLANQGMTGLQIDSMTYGDADRDRDVDRDDFALWQQAAGVPEPASGVLALLAALVGLGCRRSNRR